MKKATSLDIAHLARVSQSTVSRALRNSPLVNPDTRRRVQDIARQLNYKVDVNARNLRSMKTNTIALLLCEDPGGGAAQINPFFLSILGSVAHAVARRGYDLLVSFQQLSEDWQADYEHANRADGIILLGYGNYNDYLKKISELEQAEAHFITWGPVIPGQPGLFIGCDNRKGGYQATERLIAAGRRHIGFVGEISDGCPEFRDRFRGYRQALEAAGLNADAALQIDGESSEKDGHRAALQLLESGRPFDALVCASDLLAIGAISALRHAGHRVPDAVSVIGFDDIPTAAHMTPALTTVRQDTVEAGQVLVEKLLQLIAGKPVDSMLLPTELIVRESCGGPADQR
ncbi:MAG: LacI family DNA-binding transcriptional regulator [Pseudomonadota bacterium]